MKSERILLNSEGLEEAEFQIEWLFSNLRWTFLIAVAGVVGLNALLSSSDFPEMIGVLLIIGGVANLLVMLVLMLNAFRKPFRNFTFLLDSFLALGLILATGGTNSPVLFISLIPVITLALRFTWLPSVILCVTIVALYLYFAGRQIGYDVLFSFSAAGLPYLTSAIVVFVSGVVISYIGVRIQQTLTSEREKRETQARRMLESAHRRVRLIFELASTLSATLNYERVLSAALDVSYAGLRQFLPPGTEEVKQVQLIMLFGLDEQLFIATSRGLSYAEERLRFPAAQGALAKALHSAEPVLLDDPGSDPELGQLVALHPCRQAIVVPLRAGFESYGVLVMAGTKPKLYTSDFVDLLVAICNQAVMALQNAQLYQNLMEEKERLVSVEEDARKKLARDLHDGPTQTIAAIAMRLNFIRMLVERDPQKAIEELEALEKLARDTTKEIRQMLFTLRPLILETQGLTPALQQYVQKLAETDPTPIHLEIEPGVDDLLTREAQGACFYIIEEALTNARKHAKATDLWIRLYRRGSNVIAEVEDNGKGFDVSKVEEKYAERSSLGMMNLRERAALVGGKTVIQSTPGKGTKVSVSIPIRKTSGR